jgi:hypothetical protein
MKYIQNILKTPYTNILNQLTTKLEGKNSYDINDIFHNIKISMEFVDRISHLSGNDKKKLVISGITHLIEKQYKKSDPRMNTFLINLIEPTINIACEISKKRWFINLKQNKQIGCCF